MSCLIVRPGEHPQGELGDEATERFNDRCVFMIPACAALRNYFALCHVIYDVDY